MSKVVEELEIKNLQDGWSLLYVCLAKAVTGLKGMDGEAALREGNRQFGYDRSRNLVKLHKSLGLKLNMKNLFTYGDLPNDPRFKRERIALNPQERISNTLVCPIADLWKRNDARWLGRIYCEEFHHACYGSYAPHVQVNLAKTLTQAYDDHCCFAVYLRPGDLTPEQRAESFSEFDPGYAEPDMSTYQPPTAKAGFNKLCVKLIFHHYTSFKNAFGKEEAAGILKIALTSYVVMESDFLKKHSDREGVLPDAAYIGRNAPLALQWEDDTYWQDGYENQDLFEILKKEYYIPMATIFA